MCIDPVSLAVMGTVASVGSSAVGFLGQSQAADAQAEFQASRYASVQKSASQAYEFDVAQIGKRVVQEEAAAAQQSLDNTRQAEAGIGTARAGAASGNVGGQLLADVETQFRQIEAENEFNIRTNRNNTIDQLDASLQGSRANAINRVNSAVPQPVQRPSLLGLGFDLIGSGLNGYLVGKKVGED